MSEQNEPVSISADARGLIFNSGTKDQWIQPWQEIWRAWGEREDYGLGVKVRVTLDHINGEFIELQGGDPGYGAVIGSLSRFLPGLSPQWYDRVTSLQINDPRGPALLWERGLTTGQDGRG